VRKSLTRSIAITAIACSIAPAQALAAPVDVTSFSISPACTHPGGTISATVTVENSTPLPQPFYAETQAQWLGQLTLQTSPVYGPYPALPAVPETQTETATVPSYAVWGTYDVALGIGPSSSDPMGWSTATGSFSVSPWC
jgi:hypothetical protein